MDMRLIYLCIYVAEGITAWSYFSGMFRRRCTLLVSVAAYAVGYGTAFLTFNIADTWINGLAFALINFTLLCGCYTCPWKAGIFHAGMLTCLSTGLEFIIVLILGAVPGDYDLYQSSTPVLTILAVCGLSVQSKSQPAVPFTANGEAEEGG